MAISILALDEYLLQVDNNWYAYDWDREVFDYFTDYVLESTSRQTNVGSWKSCRSC